MLQPDSSVRKSLKRPCNDAMGSLLKDSSTLESKQKAFFEQLYENIAALKAVVEKAASCIGQPTQCKSSSNNTDNDNTNSPTYGESSTLHRSEGSVQNRGPTRGGEVEMGDSNAGTNMEEKGDNSSRKDLKTILSTLANDVKTLDVQRKGVRAWRELCTGYDKIGKSIFTAGCAKELDLLSHMDLEDRLVIRMVCMHLLHYGLLDVYEVLKNEALESLGIAEHELVPETVVSAYRMLHDLRNKLRNNEFDKLIDWVKESSECSHLHMERFNIMLLNLHRIRLLTEHYYVKDGKLELKQLDLSNEQIQKVLQCSFSRTWNLHNNEIGRLMTQILLGQNLPTPSAFLELRDETERMLVKLFCENGVKLRKNYELPSLPRSGTPIRTHTSRRVKQESQDLTSKNNDETEMSDYSDEDFDEHELFIRQPLKPSPKKLIFESWLDCLNEYSDMLKDINEDLVSVKRKKKLKICWIRDLERQDPPRCYPRITCSKLTSPILSKTNLTDKAKRIIKGKKIDERCLYYSDTLRFMHEDVETKCRQLLPAKSSALTTVVAQVNNLESMDNSDTSQESDDWEQGEDPRGVATLLLPANEGYAPRHENIENVSGLSTPSENTFLQQAASRNAEHESTGSENPRSSHPTLSLTVFTGANAVRDAVMATQAAGGDSNTRIIATDGRRIRITIPTRAEHAEILTSGGRRTLGAAIRLRPYSTENVAADGSRTPSEQPTPAGVEHEETVAGTDVANINVRGILRMIMRGIGGQGPDSPEPILQVSAGFSTPIPSAGTRTSNRPQEETEKKAETSKSSKTYKGAFTKGYEVEDKDDFVRVFLPYESPISVLVCAGYIIHPRLMEIIDIPTASEDVSTKIGSIMRSSKQLPIESDLGPAFSFHSYLTCPISKDQTSSQNLPVMLPCGHVICSLCVASFGSGGRKYQFKCPMCPQVVSPGELKQLFLDWNYCGLDDTI